MSAFSFGCSADSGCSDISFGSSFLGSLSAFFAASFSAELRSAGSTTSDETGSAGGLVSTTGSPPTVGGKSSLGSSLGGTSLPAFFAAALARLFANCSSFSAVISLAPVRTIICPSSVSLIFCIFAETYLTPSSGKGVLYTTPHT